MKKLCLKLVETARKLSVFFVEKYPFFNSPLLFFLSQNILS